MYHSWSLDTFDDKMKCKGKSYFQTHWIHDLFFNNVIPEQSWKSCQGKKIIVLTLNHPTTGFKSIIIIIRSLH